MASDVDCHTYAHILNVKLSVCGTEFTDTP